MFPSPINALLNPVTRYENGMLLTVVNSFGCVANIFKFQIIGVAQKNNCIKTARNWETSGTSVASADVSLVIATIKQIAKP